jgi:hypothetical protein
MVPSTRTRVRPWRNWLQRICSSCSGVHKMSTLPGRDNLYLQRRQLIEYGTGTTMVRYRWSMGRSRNDGGCRIIYEFFLHGIDQGRYPLSFPCTSIFRVFYLLRQCHRRYHCTEVFLISLPGEGNNRVCNLPWPYLQLSQDRYLFHLVEWKIRVAVPRARNAIRIHDGVLLCYY